MSNSDKARQLYADRNALSNESLLIPNRIFVNGRVPKYLPFTLGILIRQYAEHDYENDWIPVTSDMFTINKKDREGWKDLLRIIDLLEKNRVVETKEDGPDKYVRIVEDELFDASGFSEPKPFPNS